MSPPGVPTDRPRKTLFKLVGGVLSGASFQPTGGGKHKLKLEFVLRLD